MPAGLSDEHRDRVRRAQRLGDEAREHAGVERAAVERSERLMAEAMNPGVADVHRRTAEVHRQALRHYEEAADLQDTHAEHELIEAERARERS